MMTISYQKSNGQIWPFRRGGQFLLIDTTRGLVLAQRNFTGNSLISAGLFMMRKRTFGGRRHLMHLYDVMKEYIP